MFDSGTKPSENRIHLFDPVGLITDNYGGGVYKASSNVVVKPTRATKSYGNFEEVKSDTNNVQGVTSYDTLLESKNTELMSYDSFSMDTNSAKLPSYDHNYHDNNNDHNYHDNNNDHNDGNDNGLELRFEVADKSKDLEEESDDSTPRLWKKAPVKSSVFHPTSTTTMNISQTNKSMNSSPLEQTSPMSPNSRTRAIAKGRKELMDMVKDLPESFYELSLKDIVDKREEMEVEKGVIDISEDKAVLQETSRPEEMTKKDKKSGKRAKKSESKKKMVRSRSVDNGRFLLRTSVFPIFSGSKKNKKGLNGSNSFKIAPLPKPKSSSKVGEKDWWRRKSSDGTNGHTSTSTSASASSGSSSSSNIISITRRYFLKCLKCLSSK